MDTGLIAEIGMEGGGVTIFGKKSEGARLFWNEGNSIDLDENDDEIGRSWSSKPVNDIDLVLPGDWPVFCPIADPPGFRGMVPSRLREGTRDAAPTIHVDTRVGTGIERWREVLGMPGRSFLAQKFQQADLGNDEPFPSAHNH